MLNPSDITLSGFYWYFDGFGAPPVVVEIGPPDAVKHDLEVYFTGRADADSLREMSGDFVGPIYSPAA